MSSNRENTYENNLISDISDVHYLKKMINNMQNC